MASARRKSALDPERALSSAQERDLADHSEGDLERIWEEEWRRAVTGRCIERARKELEPATWECFDLQVFQGLDTEQVAARMNLPRAQVYDAKYRVSRRLRELERQFEDA